MVSRELIAQTLSNLIDNALKYGVAAGGASEVLVSVTRRDGICRLVIADNGPGIPEAQRERVFERFYRLDSSRTKPGSGLGLSLVQAIARLHGGAVHIEDGAPGLRVVIEFPDGISSPA